MASLIKYQNGATLIEMIILIIIVGVSLPALYTLNAILVRYHARNEIISKASNIADSRMEEIIAFKRGHDDWDKNISQYNAAESLSDGFTCVTTVTPVSNWGAEDLNAYKIEVSVTHLALENDFRVTLMLAK